MEIYQQLSDINFLQTFSVPHRKPIQGRFHKQLNYFFHSTVVIVAGKCVLLVDSLYLRAYALDWE